MTLVMAPPGVIAPDPVLIICVPFSAQALNEVTDVHALARPTYRCSAAAARSKEDASVEETEPVVHHHGRDGGGDPRDEARPSAATACWAALPID
jgi:hypothetical protein